MKLVFYILILFIVLVAFWKIFVGYPAAIIFLLVAALITIQVSKKTRNR